MQQLIERLLHLAQVEQRQGPEEQVAVPLQALVDSLLQAQMARIEAPRLQRQGEAFDYGRLATDIDGLSREAAGQSFIDGIVDDLPKTVHEATGVGRTDVHSRALSNSLKTF